MTKVTLETLDHTIRKGTALGQSAYAICQSNPTKVTCSSRSIYHFIDCGVLSTKSIDLRHKVKMKPRQKSMIMRKLQKTEGQ